MKQNDCICFMLLAILWPGIDTCLITKTLTTPAGTISSSDSELFLYNSDDGGLDLCWLIRSNSSVLIKFKKFDLEKSRGKVQIYESTKQPNERYEKFRLTDAYATTSEFWLHGDVLLRLSTVSSITKDGFSFSYYDQPLFIIPGTAVSPTAEVITDVKGSRSSHPQFGTTGYTDNLVQAWSIKAGCNRLVNLRFNAFSTEANYDTVTVFSGVIPHLNDNDHWNISGDHAKLERKFYGSLTLLFKTDTSGVSHGFEFEFNVTAFDILELKATPVFSNWSGRILGTGSFSLRVPQSDSSTSAQCALKMGCDNMTTDIMLISEKGFPLKRNFQLSADQISQQSPCIEEITCAVASTSGILINKLNLPSPLPKTLQVQLINQDLWSLTGVVQFNVVSDSVCPSVRHRCELRTASGTSLSAKSINILVSNPSKSECLSSVVSQFAVSSPAVLLPGSLISCRLSNGSWLEQRLPLLSSKFRIARWWERPLQITASVTAVVMALSCIALYLLKNRAVVINREIKVQQSSSGRPTTTRYNECYDDNQREGEVYVLPAV